MVVEGAAADRGEPLTEGELAGITGGASQMSIADLIGAVLQMAADKGDIHVKGNSMDISEKIFKDRMSSIRGSISHDLDWQKTQARPSSVQDEPTRAVREE